jgi:hypothetical protein
MGAARRLLAAVLAIVAGMLAGVGGAAADIYIMESSVPGMRVGARLAANETLTLPAVPLSAPCCRRARHRPFRGPFSGKVSDLAKGVESNESLMEPVRKILETGGSRETTTGGTRSVARKAGRPRALLAGRDPRLGERQGLPAEKRQSGAGAPVDRRAPSAPCWWTQRASSARK